MAVEKSARELPARFLQLADEAPDAEYLVFERPPLAGQTATWAEIANRSDDLMAQYCAAGIRPGDRCAVTLTDDPDMIPVLLALWRADSTAILIDPAWGARLRGNVLKHSQANFGVDVSKGIEMSRICASRDFTHPLPDGTAMLGYTSGSTGDPKGIPFTHTKLAITQHASAAMGAARQGGSVNRIGCSARLSGSGVLNLNYLWAPFADAAVVVLPELTITTARDYWHRIHEHCVDQFYLFPAQVEIVNQIARGRGSHDISPLCLTGAAPVSQRLQSRFQERFDLQLFNCYGISEAMCTIFFGHDDGNGGVTTSIGVPRLVQARLTDPGGTTLIGPARGELQLSGPTLLDYYYGNEAATSAAFDGRWFRTGDIVERDAAGMYYVVGRQKHVVMKGGFSVYLNEIEEAALAIPGILEAACVPLIDNGHEDLGLIVRLQDGAQRRVSDIRQAIQDSMGIQRSPRRVISVSYALPRTGPEKLDRAAVQRLWEIELESEGSINPACT